MSPQHQSIWGSYKFRVFAIILAVALVPVVGMFVLAAMHVATVEQAVEMTKFALGASTLGGLVTIAGRAMEDFGEKSVGKTITAGGNVEVSVQRPTSIPPPPGGTS